MDGDSAHSMEAEREMTRLWRTFRTVYELLADRGYEVSDNELALPLEEFRAKYADPLGYPEYAKPLPLPSHCLEIVKIRARRCQYTPLKKHTSLTNHENPSPPHRHHEAEIYSTAQQSKPKPQPDCGTIYVDFCPDSSGVGTKQVRAFNHLVDENNFHTGIFITQTPISPSAVRLLSGVPGRICEHFQEQDLLVNITRHELVPKHVLLSPEEKAKLLERYRLKESQLPRIQISDPVARYLGLRRGQVVKIIRKSETAGRYASYRWVI
ncbi:DNA-directed RNA polymerase RPB5 subunit [Penicillium cf. griseofulvum]|nr:DNA-directed RNA polymerase RPB5 subunit [Penicillium cf. griseofulvum]